MKNEDKIFFMERKIISLRDELSDCYIKIKKLEEVNERILFNIKRMYKDNRDSKIFDQERIDELKIKCKSYETLLKSIGAGNE